MKLLLSIFLFVLAICIAHCTPYGPRDRDIESHHSRDSSTSIQRVDNDRWNGRGDRNNNNNNNRQWGETGGRDRNEGSGRGHSSISRDSPYRY